jgi:hypothetical protein
MAEDKKAADTKAADPIAQVNAPAPAANPAPTAEPATAPDYVVAPVEGLRGEVAAAMRAAREAGAIAEHGALEGVHLHMHELAQKLEHAAKYVGDEAKALLFKIAALL